MANSEWTSERKAYDDEDEVVDDVEDEGEDGEEEEVRKSWVLENQESDDELELRAELNHGESGSLELPGQM